VDAQMRERRRRWYFRDLLTRPEAAKEIRVFGLYGWARDRFTEAAMANVTPVWKARRRIFYGPYVIYVLTASVLLVAVFGAVASAGTAGVATVGAFTLVTQSSLAAIRIGGFIPEADVQTELGSITYRAITRFERSTGAGPRLGPARPPAEVSGVTEAPHATRPPLHEIRFEKVTFRYRPDSEAILDELDLTIPAGRSLALVGLNGAGKTTLVKLLMRLYDPTAGRITVDGIDLRSIPADVWWRTVTTIFQDFVRFELSLRDNVGFGAIEWYDGGGTTDEAIVAALERAGAQEVLARAERGLDTPMSRQYTGGTDLSGGQWQRVAVARSLMALDHGATVAILDEPTAALDVRAEAEFFGRAMSAMRGHTSLIVSHRFSTVRHAEKIAVLDHGHVVEEGTHAKLLALGGRYAQMFTLQAQRFQDETARPEDGARLADPSGVDLA
jgi:ATP-binding cassette subfamily B protein